MESHRQIEDQAASFLAKHDSGEWTASDQAALDHWMSETTAHRVAFLRLEVVWDDARRLKALSAGLQRGTVPAPGEWRHSPFFNSEAGSHERQGATTLPLSTPPASHRTTRRGTQRLRFFAFAATVLVALGLGAYFMESPSGDLYKTSIGGIASIPLRDGSNITLNTATEVRVELTAQQRHIQLDDGEAFFEVAHDPTRPFVVQVGNKRVIAVGTKFSVRRNGGNVRVIVTEGKVRIENMTAIAEIPRGSGAAEVFVTPGGIATAGDGGIVVQERGLAEVEEDLSWRLGYLTFRDTSLADAVAEFNRYNVHKITIDDPSIAAIRISGTFRALNYDAFVRVLDDGFAIHARSTEDVTTLTK